MKPYLTLTAAESEDSPASMVQPRALHALLTTPTLSLTERLQKLSDAVFSLINTDLDDDALLRLLAQYRKATNALRPKLDAQLAGLMLPPNQQDVEFYHQCSKLYARLASVCKRIILSVPEQTHDNGKEPGTLSQASYWAIQFLGDRLCCAYSSYTIPPADTWYEIHQIYRYAVDSNVAASKIHVHEEHKTRNVAHVYKRVLLLGICDPYNFPFRCVHRIYRALDDWAKLTDLVTSAEAESTCLFHINAAVDSPAMPALPGAGPLIQGDGLYLITSALVNFLNQELSNSRHNARTRNPPRQRIDTALEKAEILKKLVSSWGIQPIRKAERNPCQAKCEVLVGMHSVAKLDPEADQMDAEGIYLRQNLELVDENEYGARIQVADNDRLHVRVGELVALRRQASTDTWSTGMIRWAQTNVGNRFHVGVLKFPGSTLPVLIRHTPPAHDVSMAGPIVGMWLLRKIGNCDVASLIVEVKDYRPAGMICVERGNIRQVYQIRDVVLSTKSFVWFDLSPFDATPGESTSLAMEVLE